ncbi:MAG: putative sulfate exporter family transporter [Thermodesulfobacteriota bacterium]|jgi:uncharacterized membrane protein YadS|nr:MAG: putative sulfate exporter family transporter [Thermodesulfobacteriota bacterium]
MEEKNQSINEDKLTEGVCDSQDTCKPEKKSGMSEDWLSLWLGLIIFVFSLGIFVGFDLLGWGISTKVWIEPAKALAPVSKVFCGVKGEITKVDRQKLTIKKADGTEEVISAKNTNEITVGAPYEKKGMPGVTSLFLTYLALMVIMGIGARLLGAPVGKFVLGFTIVFWISFCCWFFGNYAYIAATKNQLKQFNIPWSLSLTGEAGFIIALLVGLLIGNFFPKLSKILQEATRPELYIKTAIVIMGASLGVKAAESFGLATNVMFRGLCAIVEAYLIYWAVVYFVARKYFKFNREWAAPLASGISICGVSAAIATGAAIRARPIVPIMVSSLVVIFAVVEMLILPFLAQTTLWKEPLVAGAWMGLAVKTDGGAVASGAITDALIRAKAFDVAGVAYQEGWITMTATTVKIFIDIFIGVWAFLLAIIWCSKIECKEGQAVRVIEIWHRFPKFVIGYALTFFILLIICWPASSQISSKEKESKSLTQEITRLEAKLAVNADLVAQVIIQGQINQRKEQLAGINASTKKPKETISKAKTSTEESNVFRVLFFVLTFFTIGIVSNFKKLWEEGIGKLAAVYILCLFGFIIWIGLFISWLFFHGVKPPLITG